MKRSSIPLSLHRPLLTCAACILLAIAAGMAGQYRLAQAEAGQRNAELDWQAASAQLSKAREEQAAQAQAREILQRWTAAPADARPAHWLANGSPFPFLPDSPWIATPLRIDAEFRHAVAFLETLESRSALLMASRCRLLRTPAHTERGQEAIRAICQALAIRPQESVAP